MEESKEEKPGEAPAGASRALLDRIDSYREEIVAFQRGLIALPALGPENGGQGELAKALFVEERLRAFGIEDLSRVDAPDSRVPDGLRPNLIARLPGRRPRPAVVVLCHLDVVPPGDISSWRGDPYRLREEAGRLLGRGTEDNGQGLTASLFALRALRQEGVTPPTDVILMFVADEETGNAYGVEHVLQAAPALLGPQDLVLVPDFGTPDGLSIEIAEKSTLWVRLRVVGRQVHASLPDEGVNAHRAAAHLVVDLDRALPARFHRRDPLFLPDRSTFEPTKREASVPNVNTIPGEEVLYFDCRLLPQEDPEQVKGAFIEVAHSVESRLGAQVEVSFPVELPAAPATAPDAPVVQALSRSLDAVRGSAASLMGIGGGTVAAAFRRRGVPAAVWSTMDDMAHQPEEYSLLENLVADAKVLAHLFARER